jgi:glutathione synthase/RimK-type ligase-like ATP-grasp enzyme
MTRQFAVLGNPSNRRVRFFVRAVLEQGHPHPIVLSWLDLLAGRLDLKSSLPAGTLLRLDSPGEHPMVDLLLLEREGLHLRMGDIGWGEIVHEKKWFQAWSAFLGELEGQLTQLDLAGVINSPSAIRTMYDKSATHEYLSSAGVPQARRLGKVESFAQLLEMMEAAGMAQVFLKPFYSSSGSGVIALRKRGDEILGTTSVELVEEGGSLRLFNSLRVRTYREPGQVKKLVDRLAGEDLLAEEWLPKMTFADAVVDLRVVVINGKAMHAVLRSSQTPLTNLHLGNQRGDLQAFRGEIGEEKWQKAIHTAEKAVAAIPEAGYAGVDLLLTEGARKIHVLEVNAFGDLLPRVLYDGRDTYAAFVREFS